jgi:asparagine synthase (glutamine-hydrolysing)
LACHPLATSLGFEPVDETSEIVQGIYSAFDAVAPNAPWFSRMIYSEFKLRLPELLLMRVDKISMASSIEARVPFLDHRLVELTMDMPDTVRFKHGRLKAVLKQAVKDIVPPSVLQAKKRGFDAPMAQWLRESFGSSIEEAILASPLVKTDLFRADYVRTLFCEHRAGENRAAPIWVLFNLTQWHQHWIE